MIARKEHNTTGYPTRDWATMANAEELAGRIRKYWSDRGYFVELRVINYTDAGNKSALGAASQWCIRSNMIGGLPPKDESWPVYGLMVRP